MAKQALIIEWVVVERDDQWERLLEQMPIDGSQTIHQRRQRSFWSMTVLSLLLIVIGGWAHYRAPSLSAKPTTEDRSVPQSTGGPVVFDPASSNSSTLDDAVITDGQQLLEQEAIRALAWRARGATVQSTIEISRMVLQGDQAAVNITLPGASAAVRYRQTRFYQRTATGWRSVTPDPDLWGTEQRLKTASFVFSFRQNDAQTIAAVAPQVERLYTTMQRNFGLPISPGGEKLRIDVDITTSPGSAPLRLHTVGRFRLPAPARYLAPVTLTDAELLLQSLFLPLFDERLAQAKLHHAIRPIWLPLLSGLRLWQLWDLELPLSAWKTPVVQWVYTDLPDPTPEQPRALPQHYAELCAAYQLWLRAPAQIHIPLWCSELDRQAVKLITQSSPLCLAQLDILTQHYAVIDAQGETYPIYHPNQEVVLATLIEYAVATYGRDRLPALIAGMGQYESWQTLTPATYGVSPSQFEIGWQAYLRDRYRVTLLD